MEELIRSVWLQAGAFGLLTISGYVLYYYERKKTSELEQNYLDMLRKSIELNMQLKETLRELSESLSVKDIIVRKFLGTDSNKT